MDYRTVSSTDADDLSRRLIDESKRGVWKVIAVIKDGVLFRAFLEGTAFPEPASSATTLTERQQIVKDELERIVGDKDDKESDWTS